MTLNIHSIDGIRLEQDRPLPSPGRETGRATGSDDAPGVAPQELINEAVYEIIRQCSLGRISSKHPQGSKALDELHKAAGWPAGYEVPDFVVP
ncbi:MAG: hypothetical protein ACJ8HI_08350 [Massilia sp.]|jgi:hypothetical protein